MKTLKILISAICMVFGHEENTVNNVTPVIQQACEISISITREEITDNTAPLFQPAKAFYTGEVRSFAKANTIMSFEEGHFYLADGFWNSLQKKNKSKQELIYLAQKD